MIRTATATLLAFGLAACGSASAQQRETPYWATIDTTELNMRVGPSPEYRIHWVYRREGLPLKVLRVKDDGWRYVEDHEGAQGWVVGRMLSPERSALVIGQGNAPMRSAPADNSALKWNLAPGVVGELGDCEAGWCDMKVGQREGYVPASRLWGVGDP
jgi:SH3-like domain-containing protein